MSTDVHLGAATHEHHTVLKHTPQSADDGDLDTGESTTIHGIAIGEDDVSHGQSGTKKKWPKDTLKPAAETLQGRPLVVDHEDSAHDVVGRVTKAGYEDGTGVIYEAELFDDELAEKVQNGLLEVSIKGFHEDPDEMPEDDDGNKVVQKLVFDNLSIVPSGAAPSNTLEVGESEQLSASELKHALEDMDSVSLEKSVAPEFELYEDKDEALTRAKQIGLASVHEHTITIDGSEETYWMPGESHEQYFKRMRGDIPDQTEDDGEPQHETTLESEYKALCEEHNLKVETLATIDDVFADWKDTVNMDAEQMETWADHSCHTKASVNPDKVVERNLELFETPQDEWTDDHKEDAERAISFIVRMRAKENRPDDPLAQGEECPSKWAVSLMNWGWTPFQTLPSEPEEATEQSEHEKPDQYDRPNQFENGQFVKGGDDMDWKGVVRDWSENECYEASIEEGKEVCPTDDEPAYLIEEINMDDGQVSFTGEMIAHAEGDITAWPEGADMVDETMQSEWRWSRYVATLSAVQMPEYEGTVDEEWSRPNLEDFPESYFTDGKPDMEMVASHFIYSETDFDDPDYEDLGFPVVGTNGNLNIQALRSAKQLLPLADLDDRRETEVRETINTLAKREFGKDWGTGEDTSTEAGVSDPELSDDEVDRLEEHVADLEYSENKANLQQFKEVHRRAEATYDALGDSGSVPENEQEWIDERVDAFAQLLEVGIPENPDYDEDDDLLPKNHPRRVAMDADEKTDDEIELAGFRDVQLQETYEQRTFDKTNDQNMTDDKVDALEQRIEELEEQNESLLAENKQVRMEYAEAVAGDSGFDAEELADKFTVEELREKYDEAEEAQLADRPDEPAPETGSAGEAELSENEGDNEDSEEIAELKSEIATYEQLGWDAALEDAEERLAELEGDE